MPRKKPKYQKQSSSRTRPINKFADKEFLANLVAPFLLDQPSDMSMDDWTRLDPETGMSMAQRATAYKNGLETRKNFAEGNGVTGTGGRYMRNQPGAYKNPNGAWQMDMNPENFKNWRNILKGSLGDPTMQLGKRDWYRPGQQQEVPDYAPDEYAQRRQDAERSYWDDVFNAQGMGWDTPVNPGYGNKPPAWYEALGLGQASPFGYQRQTAQGLMSQNQLQNPGPQMYQGSQSITGQDIVPGDANPYLAPWMDQPQPQQMPEPNPYLAPWMDQPRAQDPIPRPSQQPNPADGSNLISKMMRDKPGWGGLRGRQPIRNTPFRPPAIRKRRGYGGGREGFPIEGPQNIKPLLSRYLGGGNDYPTR